VEPSAVVQVALLQAATQLPFLIVIVVGLWLAIARRKRHPGASLWAAIGLAAFGLQIAFRVAASAYVAARGAEVIRDDSGDLTSFLVLSNLATYVLFLIGVVALTCAVFVGRKAS
jgi:RsiW-degrading membrane proteinase PrsW (M82 family)